MVRISYYSILACVIVLAIMHSSLLCTAESAEVPGEPPGTISVTGTSFDHYSPDTVEIVLAVESKSITASGAANNNRTVIDKVITKLKLLLDPEQDTIKTISYTLQPRHEYDRKKEKNILVGYTAANQISVKTKKIDKAGEIIDSAISAGANRVQNINFSIVETKAFCRGLLAKAANNARDEADTVASSFGKNITGVKNASSSCSTHERPVVRHDMMLERAAAKTSTPIEAGNIKVTATVHTVFIFKN
ncbi:MAG: SIMPL domain-containing protein [Nitrospira sp.]|nr:SIMPL domain-containing protein [Nitrospira sp.]